MIAVSEVDQIFNDVIIEELANILKASADSRFAKSIRNDVRLFIQAKSRIGIPQLRSQIRRLYSLTSHATNDDRVAAQLASAIKAMSDDLRDWLYRCNPAHRAIPTPEEITSRNTRAKALQQLRLILSYGAYERAGRKRPGKKQRSLELKPLLRAPASDEKRARRPRGEAERDFVQNLALTHMELTGRQTPNTAHFDKGIRGPFSKVVHRCFELVGVPSGNVTRLINERGAARQQLRDRDRALARMCEIANISPRMPLTKKERDELIAEWTQLAEKSRWPKTVDRKLRKTRKERS